MTRFARPWRFPRAKPVSEKSFIPGIGTKTEKFVYIRDRVMFKEWVDLLKNSKRDLNTPFLATDIESSSASPFAVGKKPEVGVAGFAWSKSEAVLFPAFSRVGFQCEVPPEEVIEGVREIWQSDVLFSLHHGKMDSLYLQVVHKFSLGNGFAIKNFWFDTGLGSYALDERPLPSGFHRLDVWATRLNRPSYWEGIDKYEQEHPEANPKKGGNKNLVPARLLYPYNLNDCTTGYEATTVQYELLREQGLYDRPFRFPLMSHHNNMAMALHQNGLNVDMEANARLQKDFPEKIEGLEKEISSFGEFRQLEKVMKLQMVRKFTAAVMEQKTIQAAIEKNGEEAMKPKIREKVIEKSKKQWEKDGGVNLNSDRALRLLVYDILGCEVTKRTKKTDVASVDKKTLADLIEQNDFPILKKIGERNSYSSSYSKYVEPIPSWVGNDGRSHSDWLIHGQVTGRVSSEKPNQENLPKHNPLMAPPLRSQFHRREEGYALLEADYGQNEMRLYADRAQDQVMIQEFIDGKDTHRMGASAAFEKPESEVTDVERQKAKSMVSFGVLYLRKAKSLARDAKMSVSWAEKFIKNYFAKYHGCYDYAQRVIREVQENLEVHTYFGRVRRLPEAMSPHDGVREHAFRQAVNHGPQGDSSDLAWVAAWRLEQWLRKNNMKTRVVIVIHDAIVCDLYLPEFEAVTEKLEALMIDRDYIKKMTGWYCSVPLIAEMSIGTNLAPFADPNAKNEKDRGILIPGCMQKLKKKNGALYLPESLAA